MPGTDLDAALPAFIDQEDVRTFADALPHLVWTSDASGKVTFLNRRFTAYTGLTVEAARNDGYGRVVHPDDTPALWEAGNQTLRTATPYESELRLRRAKDGTYRWFLHRAIPVRGPGGVRFWVGTATDVDDQKRATENLEFMLASSNTFVSAASPESVCNELARLAVRRFADWCFIVVPSESESFSLAAIEHREPEKVRRVREYAERYPPRNTPEFAKMLAASTPTLIPEITDEMLRRPPNDAERLEMIRSLGMRSAIVAPLRSGDDLIGALLVFTTEFGRAFTQADSEVLAVLSSRAADAIAGMRLTTREQTIRRRLQFIGKASEALYESLDLGATFGKLTALIASSLADFSCAFHVEGEKTRVIAAAHGDPDGERLVRTFVGVRPFHHEAERRFVRALREHRVHVSDDVDPQRLARVVWPYLSKEIVELAPSSAVTITLQSRGVVYGAIVAYISDRRRRFGEDEIELLAEIGQHASTAMENAHVFERERQLAETLQESLLPPSLPDLPGMRFDAVYLPSASSALVGGDWYDAFSLEDGKIVVHAGDVGGRGANAAVVMGKVRHLLAIAPSYESDPARILDTVEAVLMRRHGDPIVTAFLAIIDPKTQTMVYANAGHPSPLLRRGDRIEELRAEGMPLGLRVQTEPATSRHADLRDAKLLVLYTDGLIEATKDILAGEQQLRKAVGIDAVLHLQNPARFIEESCLDEPADDDVAVLTVTFEPSVRWSFDAENAKAAQDARDQFVRHLREAACADDDVSTAELIFGELVGNVVRHAPGSIEIDLDWSEEAPVLHVIDRGPPFHFAGRLPADPLSERGRGLYIVRRLSGGLKVEHVPGYGNHVAVRLRLRRAQQNRAS